MGTGGQVVVEKKKTHEDGRTGKGCSLGSHSKAKIQGV